MTTHIALEEGRDLEEVVGWSTRRKLFHAQMLGAYHEYRNEQADDAHDGYGYDEFDPGEYDAAAGNPQQMAQQAGVDAVPNSPGQPQGANPASRHDVTWDVGDEDIDWQFCPQCQGMYEPNGEFEAHFENPDFNCERNQNP